MTDDRERADPEATMSTMAGQSTEGQERHLRFNDLAD
jgi:hypothetical protein